MSRIGPPFKQSAGPPYFEDHPVTSAAVYYLKNILRSFFNIRPALPSPKHHMTIQQRMLAPKTTYGYAAQVSCLHTARAPESTDPSS